MLRTGFDPMKTKSVEESTVMRGEKERRLEMQFTIENEVDCKTNLYSPKSFHDTKNSQSKNEPHSEGANGCDGP